jgi:hypothetical protein
MPLIDSLQKIHDSAPGKIFQNIYLLLDGFKEDDLFPNSSAMVYPSKSTEYSQPFFFKMNVAFAVFFTQLDSLKQQKIGCPANIMLF